MFLQKEEFNWKQSGKGDRLTLALVYNKYQYSIYKSPCDGSVVLFYFSHNSGATVISDKCESFNQAKVVCEDFIKRNGL